MNAPLQFSDITGNEHIVNALRDSIDRGRVGHAYLFSGPPKSGKTSMALVFAKAINCLNRLPEGEPCSQCANCIAFDAGSFLDFGELDSAADRTTAENMREFVTSAMLDLSGSAMRRVYVIDDVNLLGAPASFVLREALETPPMQTLFILTTRDPQGIPAPIRALTQHFDFVSPGGSINQPREIS